MSAIPGAFEGQPSGPTLRANLREANLRGQPRGRPYGPTFAGPTWGQPGADLRGPTFAGPTFRGQPSRGRPCGPTSYGADLRGPTSRMDLCGADLYGASFTGPRPAGCCLNVHPERMGESHPGWQRLTLTIGCWTGTVEALRELIAGEDWPDADEHERLRRRPILSALADLSDAHIAYTTALTRSAHPLRR